MEIVDKIVNFAHCVNCKFYETPDAEEPCHECLNNFTNVNHDRFLGRWDEDGC